MSSDITTLGEQLIAQHIGNETTLEIDQFILANITGLDPATAVDRSEQMPDPGDIVYTYDIPADFKGYVNDNQVVYSMLLGSNVGDFDFNWIGLYSSADDVVVAIAYVATTSKWQTNISTDTLGNNLTRNFLLEFTGAKECTGITVTAETWQVDFTVRLAGIDERERASNRDIYGRSCFWNDGWLVVNDAGTFSLSAGIGYVEGIRIKLSSNDVITPGVLPKDVWLDVSLQTSGADVVAVSDPVFSSEAQTDYTDGNGFAHYLVQIAEIDGAGVVTDVRRAVAIDSDVVDFFADLVAAEASARADADTDLQSNIDSEASDRAAADAAHNVDSAAHQGLYGVGVPYTVSPTIATVANDPNLASGLYMCSSTTAGAPPLSSSTGALLVMRDYSGNGGNAEYLFTSRLVDRMFMGRVRDGVFMGWVELWGAGNQGHDSGLNADTLDGEHGDYYSGLTTDHAALTSAHGAVVDATPNRIALRDSAGDLVARLFRSAYETPDQCSYFMGQQVLGSGVNNFIRPMTIAQALAALGLTNGLAYVTKRLETNYGRLNLEFLDDSTNFMIQWDSRQSTTAYTSTLNFPYTFPTACFMVVPILNTYPGGDMDGLMCSGFTTSTYTIVQNSTISAGRAFHMIAFGY